jgi:hypothetical protein
MQEELKRYSAGVVADGGTPIQGRVGINTGEVVVRSIATGAGHVEYTPIGHTTNLASRMQTAAPVGSIATTEQTRRLCEGYFSFKSLGPTRIYGVSEPVNVVEVTGLGPLRTWFQRGRGLTKFIGRQREMEALSHAAELTQQGHGQIFAAVAEPGVGKSRLLYEFKVNHQSGWMVLESLSVSPGKASAFLPVIDLLWNYFKITSDDDERTRREKVNGKVLTLKRALEDALPYLYSLLGLGEPNSPIAEVDPQTRKRRSLDAIKRILLRESLNQPLMVIFEDLHWVDEETQALLNLLADSIGTAKILMLVNYRPGGMSEVAGKASDTEKGECRTMSKRYDEEPRKECVEIAAYELERVLERRLSKHPWLSVKNGGHSVAGQPDARPSRTTRTATKYCNTSTRYTRAHAGSLSRSGLKEVPGNQRPEEERTPWLRLWGSLAQSTGQKQNGQQPLWHFARSCQLPKRLLCTVREKKG